ncbi:MAG: CRISPR-associated helicase Cas3' [Clostridia bacterium]|nr:CRISPR-associated helicase Cas3' [Clostridia bacterium]
MYIGHRKKDGTIQPLREHLLDVAELAGKFAERFDAEFHAQRVGILHDAGKYSRAAQRRMADPEHTPKVDHSTAGAMIAWNRCKDGSGAIAIAGHHGGMPDLGSRRMASEGDGTLFGRMCKDLSGNLDYSPFWQENNIDQSMLLPQWIMKTSFAPQFYTRMIFSCLVDADFLDTERFMQGEMPRGDYDGMDVLLNKLRKHIQPWLEAPETEINRRRCAILRDCINNGENDHGLYTLTVPTGGGKTVSSLAFALTHAVKHSLDRVIYVIPYTSIIEQNAAVFKSILGEENVIEHHSGIACDENEDMETPDALRRMLATENWDAPVIVTTAVQFFESLFSNKPSRCRKLHSIANSVIVFDEAQMMPLPYLKPCVSTIAELVSHYHTTAVLCTATQPALNRFFTEYQQDLIPSEICNDVKEHQVFFRRVHYKQKRNTNTSELASELVKRRTVLCIVNTRKDAQEVFSLLPKQGSFHLSTRMTPDHRSKTLDEIRQRLHDGEECRVVSTSLIEAGVDVDFPEVWREMAGLDSILQAAGRCNREGRHTADESEVVVFTLQRGVPKGIQPNAAAAQIAMEGSWHLDDSTTIRRYFEQLYWQRGDQSLDDRHILEMCAQMKMKSIAESFHMIESDTRTIYIPTEENADDIEQLRKGMFSRSLMRRLGRSAVSVYPWDWEKLVDAGMIEVVAGNCGILADSEAYDPLCGLKIESDIARGLWI